MDFLGPDDILVLEKQTGQVRRVLNGSLLGAPVLDVAVNALSERGLLGIAIDSEDPPHVFLYYTEAASDGASPIANRVYRTTWNSTLGVLESPVLVLDLPVLSGPNHDGGVLRLGPPGEAPGVGDGSLLYVVIGDLNRNGQLENFPAGAAADDTGVVLRVRQDGTPAPGNPFPAYCSVTTATSCSDDLDCPGGETCILEVERYWAYGIRNSFGLALDPVTGDLWQTENGPGSYDEINRFDAGSNSGWERIMGPDARDPQGVGDLFDMPGAGSTYDDPEFSWLDTIAPTGIVFPFLSELGAAYDSVAIVADSNNDDLYAFPLDTTRKDFDLTGFTGVADRVADSSAERNQFRIGQDFGRPIDLQLGPDGNLYVTAFADGAIYRIVGPGRPIPVLPTAGPFALWLAMAAGAVWILRRSPPHRRGV
jgi:glucose/arabinose dehydrogenase